MPRKSKNPLYIDWANSDAKLVLMEELEHNILPLEEQDVSTEFAWGVYREHPAFKNVVCFAQFKTQLAAHRAQVKKKQGESAVQLAAFHHDRVLHPPAKHNKQGERKFYLSDAHPLLREDVKEKKHEQMSVRRLYCSRPEYQQFCQNKFNQRIHQEVRYQKFVYYLNLKREEKEEKAKKKRAKAVASREAERAKYEKSIAKEAASKTNKRLRN